MNTIYFKLIFPLFFFFQISNAQNYDFNFSNNGSRVCLVESTVDLNIPSVTIHFLDANENSNNPSFVYRRAINENGSDWQLVASNLAAGTSTWTDSNVILGDVWEYQVKRENTFTYQGTSYDATGYTLGAVMYDQSDYRGRMILLVADNIKNGLSDKTTQLKRELSADGWYVEELVVAKATDWDSGDEVVTIKNQITSIYNNAPANDKPQALFILGHVPLPRCGSADVTAPDAHSENRGARGCDAYYVDIDGVFTDIATYDPGNLVTDLAINLPGDFKWDQDYFPSDIEMAFGRVDFEDLTDSNLSELELIENYLDRLSNYRNVATGFDMGENTGFYFGYDNSNDGSYRTLPNISKSENVYQNYAGANHNQWVQNNGPFQVYMQNLTVPNMADWNQYGMDATVYSSDQSYWGFGDVPQNFSVYSRIRGLLTADTKCLVTLWTTAAINIFHESCMGQPLGLAMKDIMNHNEVNNLVEKPSQSFDTPAWWNRTHFAYYGDPTIRLNQVAPAMNLTVSDNSSDALLNWTASNEMDLLGYHVYKSNDEFGIYTRLTSSPITNISYNDFSYETGDWYMVRAIKEQETGCGKYLNPSMGVMAQGSFVLSNENAYFQNSLEIFPNPASDIIHIQSSELEITSITIMNSLGQRMKMESTNGLYQSIDVQTWNEGIYFLEIRSNEAVAVKKIVIGK